VSRLAPFLALCCENRGGLPLLEEGGINTQTKLSSLSGSMLVLVQKLRDAYYNHSNQQRDRCHYPKPCIIRWLVVAIVKGNVARAKIFHQRLHAPPYRNSERPSGSALMHQVPPCSLTLAHQAIALPSLVYSQTGTIVKTFTPWPFYFFSALHRC
jgi:hypothetical protein